MILADTVFSSRFRLSLKGDGTKVIFFADRNADRFAIDGSRRGKDEFFYPAATALVEDRPESLKALSDIVFRKVV